MKLLNINQVNLLTIYDLAKTLYLRTILTNYITNIEAIDILKSQRL